MRNYSAKAAYRSPAAPEQYLLRGYYRGWLGRYRLYRETCAVRAMLEQLPSGLSVLDCPCGNGRWLSELSRKGCAIFGVDVSPTMIAHAQKVVADLPVKCVFQVGDAEHLGLPDGCVDLVFSFALTKHLPNEIQQTVLSEFARVSRRSVICSFPVASRGRQKIASAWRPTESYPVTRGQLETMAAAAELEAVKSCPCSTPIGLEHLILFRKATRCRESL